MQSLNTNTLAFAAYAYGIHSNNILKLDYDWYCINLTQNFAGIMYLLSILFSTNLQTYWRGVQSAVRFRAKL